MADAPTFQIPRDVIEPIIVANVSAAVIAALGDRGRIIEKTIASVLTAKCQSDGTPSRGYGNDIQWIQWAMQECVKRTVHKTIEDELVKHAEVIRKHISDQLKNSRSPLVRELVEGLVKSITNPSNLKYRITLQFDDSAR